jgi:hypothetical protein
VGSVSFWTAENEEDFWKDSGERERASCSEAVREITKMSGSGMVRPGRAASKIATKPVLRHT